MLKKIFILFWVIFSSSIYASRYQCDSQTDKLEEFCIIPFPQSISYYDDVLKLRSKVTISYSPNVINEAQALSLYLERDFSIKSQLIQNARTADIILLQDSLFMMDKDEAYQLDMSRNNIVMRSSSTAGIFYCIQTFRQILTKADGYNFVRKAIITDYPAFSWRAFMLDEARYFKGKQVVLDILDRMAELKMNIFHWHLTDDQGWRIEIKKYPKLTEIGAFRDSTEIGVGSNIYDGIPHGGYYTQEEIKQIIDYASKLHIQIIPEIEMPGHASAAIASYPQLGTMSQEIRVPGKLGVHYNVFDISDVNVIDFLKDVLDEVITLFPSDIIHIGGDEVRYDQWLTSKEIGDYMKKNHLLSFADLQVHFTNYISHYLADKNKRMIGWNEITGAVVNDYQRDLSNKSNSKLSKRSIIHFWKGDLLLMKKAIDDGYEVVNSFHDYTYLDYSTTKISLKKAYEFNPVPDVLDNRQKNQVLGLGCQMWGELIPTVESMNKKIYPRIAAFSEVGWTKLDNKDFSRFTKCLNKFIERWCRLGIYVLNLD